jgi:hypothetical protein
MNDAQRIGILLEMMSRTLDFGSGFLDSEEVDFLRAAAVRVGMDPWEVTPKNHGRNYAHKHKPEEYWPEECKLCECWRPRKPSMGHGIDIQNCEHEHGSG